MKNIEHAKGGLLKGSYEWILQHQNFLQLQNDTEKQLLWIKGDPGHGKTMLLIGIIEELEHSAPEATLAYFFCQGTNALMNTSTAILRGLIYRLIRKRPPFIAHLREIYDRHKSIFEDGSSFFALSEIAIRILHDPKLGKTYVILDALDECETSQDQLLSFIAQNVSASPSVKWIVSSRKVPAIVNKLGRIRSDMQLLLDLTENQEDMASAVEYYIDTKVATLEALGDDEEKREEVKTTMREKAAHTFLWAALVIQELEKVDEWDVLYVLNSLPSGLEGLYGKMISQINHLGWKNSEFCRRILATATIAYHPLALSEIAVLAGLPNGISSASRNVKKLVTMCGSFFSVQDDLVEFIHQSAKDYLSSTGKSTVFEASYANTHFNLFSRSVEAMSNKLKRNIYQLDSPGTLTKEIKPPDPDPLRQIRYSCIYWASHLCEAGEECSEAEYALRDHGEVQPFFNKHFLHWIEALSLIGATGDGIIAVIKLQNLMKSFVRELMFPDFLQDMYRFFLHNAPLIQMAPLQTYVSALLFSPKKSLTRELFTKEEPKWILKKPIVDETWSPLIQTLEGVSGFKAVTFSHDSKLLASISADRTISVWDIPTWLLRNKLGIASDETNVDKIPLVFSSDSRLLASTHGEAEGISIWDVVTGNLRQIVQCDDKIEDLAFTHDSKTLLATTRWGVHDIHTWETETWSLTNHFQSLDQDFKFAKNSNLISFSPDSQFLALAVASEDTASWLFKKAFNGHRKELNSLKFSQDSRLLVSASKYENMTIRSTLDWSIITTLDGSAFVQSSLSHDSSLLASASDLLGGNVRIWDMMMLLNEKNKSHDKTAQGPWKRSALDDKLHFSTDLERVALLPPSNTAVTISQTSTGLIEKQLDIQFRISLGLSHDFTLFAYISAPKISNFIRKRTFVIGYTKSGTIIHRIPSDGAFSGTFSFDMKLFAFIASEGHINIYNVKTGARLRTLNHNVECKWRSSSFNTKSVIFSRDSRLVGLDYLQHVVIWNLELPASERPLIKAPFNPDPDGNFAYVAFSDDSTVVAASWRAPRSGRLQSEFPYEHWIFIWNTYSGAPRQTIIILNPEPTSWRPSKLSFDPDNSWLVAVFCCIPIPTIDLNPQDDGATRNVVRNAEYLGFHFHPITDFSWVEYKGKRVLYIPPDYRPSYRDVEGGGVSFVRNIETTRSASTSPVATTTIAVQSRTGKIWLTKLSETEFDKERVNSVKSSDTMEIKRVVTFDEDTGHKRRKGRKLIRND
ncbi:unnamed protein product [Penicillium pancosmium]